MTNQDLPIREYAELNPRPLTAYERFDVVFRSFNRTFETVAEARAYAIKNDFDPEQVKPLVVGYLPTVQSAAWMGMPEPVLRVGYFIFE